MAISKSITTFGSLGITPITTAQRDLITPGLSTKQAMVYNSDLNEFQFYQGTLGAGGAWYSLPVAGIGNVTGVAPTVTDNITSWANTGGTLIKDSRVRILFDNGNNFFLGVGAGNRILTGQNNFALGLGSLGSLSSGQANIALQGLSSLTTGQANVAIGIDSMITATSAQSCVAIGNASLARAVNSVGCTAVGVTALALATGSGNTAAGNQAGSLIVGGQDNTCIGLLSGPSAFNENSDSNTFLGYNATTGNTVITNATAIGANAIVNASDAMTLGSGAHVGIGEDAALFALHMGTDHGMLPCIYMAGVGDFGRPAIPTDGLFYVGLDGDIHGGQPIFLSGNDYSSGVIVTASTKTRGSINVPDGAGSVTITTTGVLTESRIFLTTYKAPGQGVPTEGIYYTNVVGTVPGTPGTFDIIIPTPLVGNQFTINWFIINSDITG